MIGLGESVILKHIKKTYVLPLTITSSGPSKISAAAFSSRGVPGDESDISLSALRYNQRRRDGIDWQNSLPRRFPEALCSNVDLDPQETHLPYLLKVREKGMIASA
jgi:hypothetical protein